MTRYLEREVGQQVLQAMRTFPVAVVSGLRQSGKTTFLREDPALRDRRYVTLDDLEMLEQARRDPNAFVEGDEPITIDEAQRCPELLLAIKRAVDRQRRKGHFVLSGSANFLLLKSISESLAGRAIYLTMHPLSRRELAEQTKSKPYLVELFETGRLPKPRKFAPVSDADVLTGGMPPVALELVGDASLWVKGYEQTYLERDVRELSQVADLMAFRRVLQLAALRSGRIGNESEIGREAKLASSTTGRYLDLLEVSFVLSRLPPFLRSRQQRLVKTPKLYLSDSGLASHMLGIGDIKSASQERMRGPLYETYVAQNLRAILDRHMFGSELGFWNVQGRNEVDFIISQPRAAVALEVKSAARFDQSDLAGLQAFGASTSGVRALVLGYQGTEAISLGESMYAVPLGLLLS